MDFRVGGINRRRLALHLLLLALLVALLLWRIDMAALLPLLRGVDLRWATLAGIIFVLSKLVQVYRWRLTLWHRQHLPIGQLTGIFFVSTLAGTLLPLRGGDLLRVQLTAQRLRIPRAELFAAIFAVETPLNWVTLAILLTGALTVLDLPAGPRFFLGVVAALLTAGFASVVLLSRIERTRDFAAHPPLRWLPGRLRRVLAVRVTQFLHGLELLRDPSRVARAAGLCFLIWMVEVGVYWSLARAFALDLDPSEALVVMVAANLVFSLPLTPGHIGALQLALHEVSLQVGVTATAAAGFAVGSHLLLVCCIFFAGIPATWALGLSFRDLMIGGLPSSRDEDTVAPVPIHEGEPAKQKG